ncbi:MAG: hypothetical protein KAS32_24980, partial [Candidatus Peribacteraceae bacterium]|nr:hypothetical protein [Candidatus Peribacteraceae bacterium]
MERATAEEIRLLLKMYSSGYKVPKVIEDVLFEVARREIEGKDRVVLYKRDPNITSRRIQGAHVRIIKGKTMEIHPASVGGFGADFDGDTMAIYAPLSKEAQAEIKDKMITTTNVTSMNSSNFELSKEMLIGLFTLTYEEKKGSPKIVNSVDAARALYIGTKVKGLVNGKMITTTAGRFVFNSYLPKWHEPVDEPINKKKLNGILQTIMEKDRKEYVRMINELSSLGFYYSTIYPKTLTLDLLKLNPKLIELRNSLSKEKDLSKQNDIINEIEKELLAYLKKTDNDLYYMIASGGAKGINQTRQLMVCKGIISDVEGNVLPPITTSIGEGYDAETYFQAAAGGRKGTIDRSLNTADGGYAYRKVIYVVGNVQADINLADCYTRRTLDLKLTKDIIRRMKGRYHVDEKGRILPVTPNLEGQIVKLRSPIFCKSNKICRTCYGDLLKQIRTENVGIISAQEGFSLSERIMKSFHTGGAVLLEKVDIINYLMDNLDDIMLSKVKSLVKQKDNDLFNGSEVTIIQIKKSVFDIPKYKIEYHPDHILLPLGHFMMMIGNIEIKVAIEQPVKINLAKDKEEDDKVITLTYNAGEKILMVDPMKEDFSRVAKNLDQLIGGKSPWSDVPSLYKKFYRALASTGGFDSVHLEVLISNILRARKNPQKPARLVEPFDPQTFSIKTLPSLISYPLGIAFEDLGKALQHGLVSERAPE